VSANEARTSERDREIPAGTATLSPRRDNEIHAPRPTSARVAGRGHAMLRAAGISVDTGLLGAEAQHLQRGFLSRIRRGRPMVTLKLATSLDGRIATRTGESQWITGPEARRMVHLMRARHDAVLVGAGTARADDPLLNVRGIGPMAQPLRLVAARTLDLPQTGRLAASARDLPLWLLHGPSAPADRRAAWQASLALVPPLMVPERSRWSRLFHGGEAETRDGKVVLKGVGTSGGRITAPACVLFGPDDFGKLRRGDVLVAVTTTPAWTPLFAQAAAVVTDIGGPLSHSSIVAREYGIPAVMAARTATRAIRNGQLVTVDGTAGTITLGE
jgi:phosphohistidine swiveling domain-containing protein